MLETQLLVDGLIMQTRYARVRSKYGFLLVGFSTRPREILATITRKGRRDAITVESFAQEPWSARLGEEETLDSLEVYLLQRRRARVAGE